MCLCSMCTTRIVMSTVHPAVTARFGFTSFNCQPPLLGGTNAWRMCVEVSRLSVYAMQSRMCSSLSQSFFSIVSNLKTVELASCLLFLFSFDYFSNSFLLPLLHSFKCILCTWLLLLLLLLQTMHCPENSVSKTRKKRASHTFRKSEHGILFLENETTSRKRGREGKKRVWLSNLQKQKEREGEKRMKWKLKDLVWRKLLWRRLRQRGRWVLHANFFLSFSLSFFLSFFLSPFSARFLSFFLYFCFFFFFYLELLPHSSFVPSTEKY